MWRVICKQGKDLPAPLILWPLIQALVPFAHQQPKHCIRLMGILAIATVITLQLFL